MSVNYQRKIGNAVQIKNWDEASDLLDELIGLAGLTDEATEKAQADFGRKTAEYMNSKGKDGRKI